MPFVPTLKHSITFWNRVTDRSFCLILTNLRTRYSFEVTSWRKWVIYIPFKTPFTSYRYCRVIKSVRRTFENKSNEMEKLFHLILKLSLFLDTHGRGWKENIILDYSQLSNLKFYSKCYSLKKWICLYYICLLLMLNTWFINS